MRLRDPPCKKGKKTKSLKAIGSWADRFPLLGQRLYIWILIAIDIYHHGSMLNHDSKEIL
jgi:hypothetical protein